MKQTIGTHNSFSYLPPARWYGYFMLPFARCQSKTATQQYDAGARCFDVRVRFKKGRTRGILEGIKPVYALQFAHGMLLLRGNVLAELKRLSLHAKGEMLYLRVVLEDTKALPYNETEFKTFCRFLQSNFHSSFILFQGNRKGDWKQVVDFDFKPTLAQCVGSMAEDARWYEKIVPWLYARRMNRRNMANPPQADIAIYDFI